MIKKMFSVLSLVLVTVIGCTQNTVTGPDATADANAQPFGRLALINDGPDPLYAYVTPRINGRSVMHTPRAETLAFYIAPRSDTLEVYAAGRYDVVFARASGIGGSIQGCEYMDLIVDPYETTIAVCSSVGPYGE